MKKTIKLLLFALLPALLLSGCRLAKPEAAQAAETDRLIGAFITWAYLDLFDFEAYFNDNASKVMSGGEISAEDNAKYTNRIYAVLKSETLTGEDGDQVEHMKYVFENLEGVPFFMPYMTPSENISYWSVTAGPEICDTKVVSGSENILEGTIYVSPEGPMAMYINPVYQEPGGAVYLIPGTGLSQGGDIAEGTAMSSTISETHTVNENGEERSETTSIKITMEVKNGPETVAFLEMDDHSNLLATHRFKQHQVPEKLDFGPDTAYVIVESRGKGASGETVSREILSPNIWSYTCRFEGERGILEAVPVSLVWAKGQQN